MKKVSALIFCVVPFLMGLSRGDQVPNFEAKNQDGKMVHLSDHAGKYVVVYFYPKDDTPGCKKEALSLRDAYPQFLALHAVVLGVSRQGEKSHQNFKKKYTLPFDLLVDEEGTIAKTLGVSSVPILGLSSRETVLIGPDRKLVKFYEDVDPGVHTLDLMKDIQADSALRKH
jgi:peroxiredoxin Q/BCP